MNDPTDYPIASAPTPAPDDGPAAALRRQLDALADDDTPIDDAGIETAYNFASPAARRRTGSYERFARLFRSPRYAPLVDHVEAVTGPLERDWNDATRRVTVTGPGGRTRTYEFRLSPATTGPFRNCWQTDAVVVV
ncbi:DUF4864 domain-containing protein [Halobacteriales archaeon QS_9_70_65]|nr:MAG: DUF4864 domain-containing protein [Halobacteriales archaeon QS_9_70_65]